MRDYRKIKAWKLADDLAVQIYQLTKQFPKDEMFALTSQLRRAGYSVPSNIAEGAGRRTTKDFLRFLDIAKGSINEVMYFLHLADRLAYLTTDEAAKMSDAAEEVAKCLSGYIKAVESDLK
ncbi:MAG: four helix bundle protein [Pontiella sp.]|nr:four helix bundle protein [Pontiella sp.]